jgi:hypothetical protein
LASPAIRATGTYPPPSTTGLDVEKLVAEEAAKPVFRGEIGAFRILGPGDPTPRFACTDPEQIETRYDVLPEQLPISIGYFPPGTSEGLSPMVTLCPDGNIRMVGRYFDLGEAHFTLRYWAGEREFKHDSLREGRFVLGAVRGNQAVLVKPLAESGLEQAIALWPVPGGYFELYAVHVSMDDVLRIAESVRCIPCDERPLAKTDLNP